MRNILFDLDDTLLDFRLAERLALTQTLCQLGIEPKEEVLSKYSELNRAQWKLLEQGKTTRSQVKVRRYELLFDEIGVTCSADTATECYEELLREGHYFVDGAESLLKTLSGVCRLYLVTNGTAAVQKSRIASSGIARYLDDVFISQEIGFDKPDVRFFDYCFSRIPGFQKQETLIVGDSLSSDIKGGRDAGITTVWFNPNGAENAGDIVPDHEIRRLLDLLPLVGLGEGEKPRRGLGVVAHAVCR